MVNARSIAAGVGIAAAGIALGYFFDRYLSEFAQGTVFYNNDAARAMGDLFNIAFSLGGVALGVYQTFWSPMAQNNPPAGPPGGAGGAPNVRVYQRGNIRNRFGP